MTLAKAALSMLLLAPPLHAGDWSGNITGEFRGFFHQPATAGPPRVVPSMAAQPEYSVQWGSHSILASPFFRIDPTDPRRTHVDVRELLWQKIDNGREVKAGVGRVFWGVTESQHLVDIINQTDFVENIDSEDKLGQPMVNVTLVRGWGNLDVFVLPGFRERTFPGADGRLRFPLRVASEFAEFEAASGKRHVDLAARWSHFVGDWDIGLYHFRGTSREPRFLPDVSDDGEAVLVPLYEIIHQSGLDVQATKGSWLWKLEAITRGGQEHRFNALTGGFEYTFANVRGSGTDIGFLAEYLFDDRRERATTPFEDDLFLAARVSLNDVDSTTVLGGVVVDRDTGARFINVEASRRVGTGWRLTLEARAFAGLPDSDYFAGFGDDDYLQVELGWYF